METKSVSIKLNGIMVTEPKILSTEVVKNAFADSAGILEYNIKDVNREEVEDFVNYVSNNYSYTLKYL